MNCHKNKREKKHGLLMILCCLLPIIIFGVLAFLPSKNVQLQKFLSFGVFLLCPLLHIFMMKGMACHSKDEKKE